MQRRKFLVGAGAAGAATLAAQSARAQSGQSFEWRMTTTWPKDFPGLGTGANNLARLIDEMSGGRLKVTVFGGGEIVPALGAFDAVSKGTVEMGHGAAYYWKSKTQAAQFFAAVPFGFNAQELNAWVYQGGGQALWDEIYADFNLKPFLAGNTGVQMGGWFNRKIESIDDFKGLKMRIPGLGGEVLSAIGGTPNCCPAARFSLRCNRARSTPPNGSGHTTTSLSAFTKSPSTIIIRAGTSRAPGSSASSTATLSARCRPICKRSSRPPAKPPIWICFRILWRKTAARCKRFKTSTMSMSCAFPMRRFRNCAASATKSSPPSPTKTRRPKRSTTPTANSATAFCLGLPCPRRLTLWRARSNPSRRARAAPKRGGFG